MGKQSSSVYKVKAIEMHPTQKVVLDSIVNESYKTYVVSCGRGWGKSILLINLSLWGLFTLNKNVGVVCPTYAQAKKLFRQLQKGLKKVGSITFNKSDLIVKYNSNIIRFYSVERYDNFRGENEIGVLLCDEFAFYDSEAWTEVLRPIVATKVVKFVAFSTPKGKNHFYDLYMEEDSRKKTFRFPSESNPHLDIISVMNDKKTMNELTFKQERLAEFIDDGGEVFTNFARLKGLGKLDSSGYYIGIDIAKMDDYTSISVLDKGCNLVLNDRINGTDYPSIVAWLSERIRRFKNPNIYLETNSVGNVVFDYLVKEGFRITPIITANKLKSDYVEALIYAINSGSIRLGNDEELFRQLEVFEFKYNPKTGTVTYQAKKGFKDDNVISLALALKCYNEKRLSNKITIVTDNY
jgi:hypothetical protein